MVLRRRTRADVGETFAQGAAESGIVRRPLIRDARCSARWRLLPLAAAGPAARPRAAAAERRCGTPLWEDQRPARSSSTDDGARRSGRPTSTVGSLRASGAARERRGLRARPERAGQGRGHPDPAAARGASASQTRAGTGATTGIVAYSKICTHVGCPVAPLRADHAPLLCPCHQSTFDVADGGKVVFGPAARTLPQLAITVDDEGYLVAQGDFAEPVGPSFWERG